MNDRVGLAVRGNMSINSRKAYGFIRKHGKGPLKEMGFRPEGRPQRWLRDVGDGHALHLWFQCDKNGWSWTGNSFTINFEVFDRDTGGPLLGARYGREFDAADKHAWLEQTNRVIARLATVEAPPLYDWESPEDHVQARQPERSVPTDPWLRFLVEEDIEQWWGGFLEPRLEAWIARFIEPPLPDYRQVEVPSLRVLADGRGSILSIARSDVAALSAGLTSVLEGRDEGVCTRHGGVLVLFDGRGRSGGFAHHHWGLKRSPVTWGSFSAVALAELIGTMRILDAVGPEVMGKSAAVSLHVTD